MCSKVNYTFTSQYKKPVMIPPKNIKIEPSLTNNTSFIFSSSEFPEYKKAKIIEIQKIPTTWKETFKIKLDVALEYTPCDSIGILVPNSDLIVDKIFNLCKFDNIRLKIERSGINGFVFDGILRDFIKFRMDLNSIPKKKCLLELSKNAKKSDELEYLCSVEGSKDYLNLGRRMNTLLDIIEEFECVPTVEQFLVHCEILKPRYYSLIHNEGPSEILLGIVSNEIDGSIIYGHVSEYIKAYYNENITERCIEYCIRKSNLFEGFNSKNVICFCTGTGVAPFIAFYRKYLLSGKIKNLKIVYGFRSDEDNLLSYYDIDCFDTNEANCEIVLAKSSNKNYVYDFIDVINQLQDDCDIFICGNIKMQRDVFCSIKSKFPRLVDEKRIYFDNWL